MDSVPEIEVSDLLLGDPTMALYKMIALNLVIHGVLIGGFGL